MSKSSKKARGRGVGQQRKGAADVSAAEASEPDSQGGGETSDETSPEMTPWPTTGPGSKDPSRRCTATAHRTGERCRAPAIKGAVVCRVHGGASGQVKKKAKERLLELVDPALASLDKVLRDPKTDDSVKVRAATAILDRTGFRPGMVVTVEPDDKWSQLLNSATSEIDRSLPGSESQEQIERDRTENAVAVGEALRSEAWAEVDHEETREYRRGRIWPDENTVQGEVVDPPPPGDRGRWNEYEQRLRDDLGDDA